MLRRHRRALAVLAIALLAAVGSLFRLSPLWPGPALPAGATRLILATEPAHLMPAFACPAAALVPARIGVEGDALVLVPEAGGEPIDVIWPSGWDAWIRDGRAELVDRNGSLVGREGDIVDGFGGGTGADSAFHICAIGS